MGLIWTDAFDSYTTTTDLTGKWANSQSPWTYGGALGRNGGGGVSCVTGTTGSVFTSPNYVLPNLGTGIYVAGFYVKLNTSAPGGPVPFVAPVDINGQRGPTLGIGAARTINLMVNGTAINPVVGNTLICDGNWHHIEWRWNQANAANTHQVYLDGNLEISVSNNFNTSGRAATALRFEQMNGPGVLGLAPVYAYDSNGAPNASSDYPLGQLALGTKRPNSDQGVQFTPTPPGTNFSKVNEQTPDGDTSYVQDATNGDQDLYGYTNLPNINVTPSKIWGAMLNGYVENPVTGTQRFQQIAKSGATQVNGATTVIPTSYATLQQAFNLDPNGNVTWTLAALDAAFFGVRVV
jgi:hypothetical protein